MTALFSPQRFETLVRGNGMTPIQYKEAMRKQLLVSQLLSGYAATEFITQADHGIGGADIRSET